jgi:hypothetical protein
MLYSTEATGSRRVPDVRAGFPGSARAAAAGAAVAAGASGSAARAGRPREQVLPDAWRWAGNPPRAPPAASQSRTRSRAGDDAGPMWRIGPAISDHSLSANDRDVHDASNPKAARHQRKLAVSRSRAWSARRQASFIAGSAPMIRACPDYGFSDGVTMRNRYVRIHCVLLHSRGALLALRAQDRGDPRRRPDDVRRGCPAPGDPPRD